MKRLEVGPFLVLDILFLFKLRNNRKLPVVPKFDNKKISNHYGKNVELVSLKMCVQGRHV